MLIDLEKNVVGEVEVRYRELRDESNRLSLTHDAFGPYGESEHCMMQLLLAKAYSKHATPVLLLPEEVRYDEYNNRIKLCYKVVPISA